MTPLRVRGYAVERFLGGGSSGDVWQARVLASGASVALKRITIRDDDQRRRAEAEAALLAALDHPNLVRLHSLVASDEDAVLVLDLAEGGSLAGLLQARRRLAPGEVITAVAPVAAALAYLHDEGVVHGDVSAANILFTAAGVPLLADVGVARLTGDDADAEATPAYVDPAVAAGCVPGPPSDVFMLAGVALHALTGTPPWPDADAEAALARAAGGLLADLSERFSTADVPPAMAATLSRALSVDPHRRGTAADLALDLAHSGQPVAVELSAGLAARPPVPAGPRHAARAPNGDGQSRPGADPARPAFERPSALPEPVGGAPPTRMVGPRPRPVIPRPPRHRRVSPVVTVAAAALAAAFAAVGVAWAGSAGTPHHKDGTASDSQPQIETTGSGADVATPKPVSAIDWGAALDRLDARRARAFATRDAALLSRVYIPGPLLDADRALLARIVPEGCGLAGVRTRFARVHAAAHGTGAVISTVATLPASHLACHGRVRGTAPGAGPAPLRIVLARTPDGLRIAREQVLSATARPAAPSRDRDG